jgi:hypothetical protein
MKKNKTTRVSRVEAERMYKLFLELGTYVAVAKKMDRSPDTVSRWVKILEAETTIRIH